MLMGQGMLPGWRTSVPVVSVGVGCDAVDGCTRKQP